MKQIVDPRTLIGTAIYLEDGRFYGTVGDIELPDVSFGSVETGTAMKREQVVPVLEAMKARIKVHGDHKELVAAAAKQITDSTKVFIRNDMTTAKHDSVEITLGGNVKVLKNPLPKTGEKAEAEIEINTDLYIFMVNGEKYYEIDAKNLVCMINGVDLMAETRANL